MSIRKLFLIKTRGLGQFYVVAEDPNAAYRVIRGDLDNRDYGFPYQRELHTIELLATAEEYPDCKTRLMIQPWGDSIKAEAKGDLSYEQMPDGWQPKP